MTKRLILLMIYTLAISCSSSRKTSSYSNPYDFIIDFILKKIVLIAACLLTFSIGLLQAQTDSLFRISIDNQLLSAPEALSLYIQKRSISYDESYAGSWLKSICAENGLIVYDYGSDNGKYNFAATLRPLSDSIPNVILLNHIDVVDAGDSNLWIHPPFSGFISDTDIWGRGAFDNKGAAIMQLFSLLEFKSIHGNEKLKHNITFLAVSCEETICNSGVTYVLENYLTELNPVAVIGEGATELGTLLEQENDELIFGISVGIKRPLWLELELSITTAGHGSVTPIEYANKEMVIALSQLVRKKTRLIYIKENKDILKILADQKSGIPKFILNHPHFFKPIISRQIRKRSEFFSLFSNTVTVTSINSHNETVNIIPNKVTAIVDCMLLPEFPQDEALEFISGALDNDDIQISMIKSMDPIPVSSPNNPFYQDLESAVKTSYKSAEVFPIILPVFNDVGKFRSYGIQGYSIIPIQLDIEYLKCAHAENERIPIKALLKGAAVYLIFLENVQIQK